MAEQANDVNTDVESVATATESSTEETTDTELDELDFGDEAEENQSDQEPSQNEGTVSDEDQTKAKTTDEESSEEESEEPITPAEKRKQQLNTEIRDKVAERNKLRAEIAELNKQKYNLNTDVPQAQDLVQKVNPDTGEYYTKLEAELVQMKAEREAERKQKELDDYTEKIVERNIQLREESERVLKDYPMFDQESSEYNKPVAEAANAILERALVKDQRTGQIIDCNVSPYQLYSTIAEAMTVSKQAGEAEARKNVQKMMNSTEVVNSPSSVSKKDDYDPYMDGFDS